MSAGEPLVGVTMGDPAGVGSEVIVKAYAEARGDAALVVIGDASVLRDAVDICGGDLDVVAVEDPAEAREIGPGTIPVLDLGLVDEHVYGEVREAYGAASLAYVERAIELAQAGVIDAIVTAPINKQATRRAGSEHAGHTGLLAERTGTEQYAMLLIEGSFRVSHVSTHVPLSEAIERVTADAVFETIEVTADALGSLGIDDPRIAVAGLNPHASDGGMMGHRDLDEIEPAVERAREAGIDAHGPEPPDTVFVAAARGDYDAVVAMYHDQGHIPLKLRGFDRGGGVSGVNVTIGLPIVRTSVDHGTAFDIAGEGVASETSLLDAVRTAVELAG